jgi:exopolysaccharide biosynthesis operon protein EpsL
MVSWCRALALGSLLGVSAVCHGQDWDSFNMRTLSLSAKVKHEYDSNIFRISDGDTPEQINGKSSKSDRVTSISVGGEIDKRISLQRFRLAGRTTHHYYEVHTFQDHDDKDFVAAWDWSLGSRLNGTLSVSQVQRKVDPETQRDDSNPLNRIGTLNQTTVRSQRFDLDWWAHSNIHFLAGIGHDERRNDIELDEDRSSSADRWQLGVRYEGGGGRNITFAMRRRNGDRPNDFDPDRPNRDEEFDETEYGVLVGYSVSADTRLIARIAHLEHDEPNTNTRDFSGMTGNIGLDWTISPKLSWDVGYEFDLRPWTTDEASYADIKMYSTSLRWAYTERQDVRLRFEYKKKDHKGRLPNFEGELRENRSKSAGLAWNWKPPVIGMSVEAAGNYTVRDSNEEGADYDVYGLGVTVQQQF